MHSNAMILNYIIAFTKLVAKVAKKNDNKNEKLQSVYNTNAQKEKSLFLFREGAERKNEKKKKEVLTKRLLSAMIGTVSDS